MKKLGITLASLLIVAFLIGSIGCGGVQIKAILTPTPTLPPKIGDGVVSGSIRTEVLEVIELEEVICRISSNDRIIITANVEEGFSIFMGTLEIHNLDRAATKVLFARDSTVIRDSQQQQYQLSRIAYGQQDDYSYLSNCMPPLAKLETKSAEGELSTPCEYNDDVWTFELEAEDDLKIILLFIVPVDSSGFLLSIPDFPEIMLEHKDNRPL